MFQILVNSLKQSNPTPRVLDNEIARNPSTVLNDAKEYMQTNAGLFSLLLQLVSL